MFGLPDETFSASKFDLEGKEIVCLLVDGLLLSALRAAAVAREKRKASAPKAQPGFVSLGVASEPLLALTSSLIPPQILLLNIGLQKHATQEQL